MEDYISVLMKCTLFRDTGEQEFRSLLGCLNAQIKDYKAGDYVFMAGDKVSYVSIVISGVVELMKESLAGNKHIVAFLGPSDMFAEGIVCTKNRISPVTVRIKEDAKILSIPYERVIRSCGRSCDFHIGLIRNMMMVLGEKNIGLNKKIELLSFKGMREKLAGFLLNEQRERESKTFQIMLNRTELADYLNVSRTSMCRELGRMKDEGMIDYYGRSFKILDSGLLARCLE